MKPEASYGDGDGVDTEAVIVKVVESSQIIKDAIHTVDSAESVQKQRVSSELLSERNDAIWEQLASPDHLPTQPEDTQHNDLPLSLIQTPSSPESTSVAIDNVRVTAQNGGHGDPVSGVKQRKPSPGREYSLSQLRRGSHGSSEAVPHHHSVDLDNIIVKHDTSNVTDNAVPETRVLNLQRHRRPLSDHLLESHDFSFCPKEIVIAEPNSRNILDNDITSLSNISSSAHDQVNITADQYCRFNPSPSPSSSSSSTSTSSTSSSSSATYSEPRPMESLQNLSAQAANGDQKNKVASLTTSSQQITSSENRCEDLKKKVGNFNEEKEKNNASATFIDTEEATIDPNLRHIQNNLTQIDKKANSIFYGDLQQNLKSMDDNMQRHKQQIVNSSLNSSNSSFNLKKESASYYDNGNRPNTNPTALMESSRVKSPGRSGISHRVTELNNDSIEPPDTKGRTVATAASALLQALNSSNSSFNLKKESASYYDNGNRPNTNPTALMESSRVKSPGHSGISHRVTELNNDSIEPPDTKGRTVATAASALLQARDFVQKAKTKSRLIEVSVQVPPHPSSLANPKNSSAGNEAPVDQHKSSGNEDEEDPFKDIDTDTEFSHGNFKILTVLQWLAFVLILGGLVCSLTVKPLKGKEAWDLELWKWILMVLVIFCGRLVSGWLIHILVFIFEKNFLLRKKLLYFVYGLRKGVQNCLWLGLTLLAWKLMIDPVVETSTKSHRIISVITNLFECFVIAAFIWLAKLLMVKSLASSFHVSTFFDRIQESLFNQHILESLSGPSFHSFSRQAPAVSSMSQRGPSVSEKVPSLTRRLSRMSTTGKGSRPITPTNDKASNHWNKIRMNYIRKLSSQDISAGLITKLIGVVKHPGFRALVTTIDEEVDTFETSSQEVEINSELQAKIAAKLIFRNVAQPDSGFITREDLLRFIPEEEINNVMVLFEGAKDTGKISKKALKNWVVKVYQERRSLAHSLNDTKTAVKELHRMASVIVSIIIIVVWLLVLGIASTQILVFAGSQLLLVAFMFGNTVKQIFEAIIFLFVMHPYDVGDRCIVDGVQLVVEEMKILTTVFLKPDNEKVFYPNSVLATKPISNLYRSPEMKDFLDFAVHISTTTEKINAFKEKIAGYVEKKSEHWQPKFSVIVKELEELNRLKLSVTMQHTINFQNFGERMSRRSELLLEMKKFFSDLGIEYRLLTQPLQILSPYPSSQYVNTAYPYPPPEYAGAQIADPSAGGGGRL